MHYLENAQLLYQKAQEMGLHPEWLTNQGVFSIQVRNKTGFIIYDHSMMNSHASSFLAKHKYATRAILEKYRFPNIPYAMPEKEEEANIFLKKHKIIIVKPTLGSFSQDVHMVTSVDQLKGLHIRDYIFEKYIKGKEMRYLVMQNKIQAVHEKVYDGPINDPELVQRISYPQDAWDPTLVEMSLRIAKLFYLKFASVDFLIDEQGKGYILEVNRSPGLYHFHYPTKGPAIDVARMFLEETVKEIERQR